MVTALGIELGNQFSCVAVMEKGYPVVIPNHEGKRLTPSVVNVSSKGDWLVGTAARRVMIVDPKNTVHSFQRVFGRQYNSEEVSQAKKVVSYDIVEGSKGEAAIRVRGKSYSTVEIAATILKTLKLDAESFLGETIEEAVLSIPAQYTGDQRQAIWESATLAGLKVLSLIETPVAIAPLFGLEARELSFAVLDLREDVFSVAIVGGHGGDLKVLASVPSSGGDRFDERIGDWVIEEFKKRQGINLLNDRIAVQRVREAAQIARQGLSSLHLTEFELPYPIQMADDSSNRKVIEIYLPFISASPKDGSPVHLRIELPREVEEQVLQELFDDAMGNCLEALKRANLKPSGLDDVVLLGEQAAVYGFQEKVTGILGKEPRRPTNPYEVAACGAALEGSKLTGQNKVLLLDVTPLSLGVESATGSSIVLIPKNTVIPVERSIEVTTVQDFQPSIEIHVVQGERTRAINNRTLGRVVLDGISLAPRGMVRLKLNFSIDLNGILQVAARDEDTDKEVKVNITAGAGLSKVDMDKAKKEADLLASSDALWNEDGLFSRAESQIFVAQSLLSDFTNVIDAGIRNDIEGCIRNLKPALSTENVSQCQAGTIALTRYLSALMLSLDQTDKRKALHAQITTPGLVEKEDDLFKQFHVSRILEGGMGKVYIVKERQLAIKTLRDDLLIDRKAVDRFISEALTWTKLDKHSNVVSALLVRKFGHKPYLFLEYVEGGNMGQLVGKLNSIQVLDIGIQICTAMEYVNQKMPGLVHRDIKPANILLKRDDSFISGYLAKVTDFGLAKAIDPMKYQYETSERWESGLSRGVGTLQYMPPEQFPEDTQKRFSFEPYPVTTCADIYSFGVTLYELISEALPFYSVSEIFTANPQLVGRTFQSVPDQLKELILKCLAKRPEDRFQNFTELVESLKEIYKRTTNNNYEILGKVSSLDVTEWISKGISFNTLSQFTDGAECFRHVLELTPGSRLALVGIADSYAGLGEFERAISYYDEADKASPGHWYAALVGKGRCLNRIEKNAAAIACYEEAYRAYIRQSIAKPPEAN